VSAPFFGITYVDTARLFFLKEVAREMFGYLKETKMLLLTEDTLKSTPFLLFGFVLRFSLFSFLHFGLSLFPPD
jgi:hypothetical protein